MSNFHNINKQLNEIITGTLDTVQTSGRQKNHQKSLLTHHIYCSGHRATDRPTLTICSILNLK